MHPDGKRYPALLMTAVLAAAISGCGGGGSTKTDTDTGMTGGTDTGMTGGTGTEMPEEPTLTIEEGLARSTATPVTSGSAGDTLATLLPDSTNQFTPLTSTIQRDFGASSTTTGEAYVKTIASDGDNGFHVTFVVGAEERSVHFEEDDYASANYWYYKEVDGVEYWFGSHTDSYHGAEKNLGTPRFRYVDLSWSYIDDAGEDAAADEGAADQSSLAYGARTDAAALPSGSASYTGVATANTYLESDPSRSHQERISGTLRLAANFDDSTLDGMILEIRKRTRDASESWNAWSSLSDTTRFEIADGRIVDGQFTATLTGTDSNAAAAPQDTVGGYEGGILGEFYGPAAEEVGGVLNASSDDRVMLGAFAGKQTDPDAAPPTGLHRNMADPVYASSANDKLDDLLEDLVEQGTRFAPLTSALRSDWVEVNSALDDDTYVEQTWVEDGDSDDDSRIHVAYVVHGQEQKAEFGAADFDPQNEFEKEIEGGAQWLWSVTGSFHRDPGYSYVDVYGFGHWVAGLSYRTYMSVGVRTDPANMPTGSATYAGRIRADAYKQDNPSSDFRYRVSGDLNLTADFDAGTLEGNVSGIHTRGQNESSWSPLSETTSFEIGSGQIADGQFTADLTGADTNSGAALDDSLRGYEGNVLGEFYGPAAEEVGGVFTATRDADQRVLYGALHGRKQSGD